MKFYEVVALVVLSWLSLIGLGIVTLALAAVSPILSGLVAFVGIVTLFAVTTGIIESTENLRRRQQ